MKINDYQSRHSTLWLVVLGILLLFALSILSYYFIEQKYRRSNKGVYGALALVILTFSYVKWIEPPLLKELLYGKPIQSELEVPTWYGKYYDVKTRGELGVPFKLISNCINTPEREVNKDAYLNGGVLRLRRQSTPRVVVLGDSHAIMWCKLIDDLTAELNISVS